MLNFLNIASGSRGNSTVIWDEYDAIIIDFGISLKRYKIIENKFSIPGNRSLFITHEHGDHSRNARAMSKYADVYSRAATLESLGINGYKINDEVAIGNFFINAVSISHDAVDPVGYIIKNKNIKISVVSDLGFVGDSLIDEIKNSNLIALEANHDPEMLASGPYPEHLKARIKGRYGHLSNEQSAEAIYLSNNNSYILLTHLSEKNNTPELAYKTVYNYLKNRNARFKSIECASQYHGSSLYNF
ncbi:MBL fold metallo-hydrolase [Picrophilus oshimae]|uniref:Phosphoribosyl 1,2-cyclic phosphodiesterase n=1 Tax=Picrophilus torridus (strain ATCC 700027 / DSM 9790 / JCM 10055 / NBRC 100828 / KAW 2/3) TaxID=1122961 RepID=A0A8G2FWA2_PICTO|nr:MBL fold metallo-hydrolase [Picrophilus oshimae]SMD30681.1 Phosphoribosyl 1,2-cyclic phosphodiesterase [Picrophilus oshimae DSM 9789]